jgi:DNA-binding LytR/AlgR family response regulator
MAVDRARPAARPPPVTAVIAEDEQHLRDELWGHLTRLWPGLKVVASVGAGTDALAMFERHRPDIMFLDIQMPGLTGLEVAQQVGDRCQVVFITAYDSHAVAAFEHGAVDYVLKPYDTGRLGQALRRAQSRMGDAPPALGQVLKDIAAATAAPSYLNWVRASHGAEVSLITVRDVCYFRAETKYTTVATPDRDFIIRKPIRELVAELDPALFWQIHRSTIVNAEAIGSVSRNLAGQTVLKLRTRPERLTVSEAHRHLFRHM